MVNLPHCVIKNKITELDRLRTSGVIISDMKSQKFTVQKLMPVATNIDTINHLVYFVTI